MIESILAENVELSKENIIFYTLADIMLERDMRCVLAKYGSFENAKKEGEEDKLLLTGLFIAYDCKNVYDKSFFRRRDDYDDLIGDFLVPDLRERLIELSDRVDGALIVENDSIIKTGYLEGLPIAAARELGKEDGNEVLRFYYGNENIGGRRAPAICAPLVKGNSGAYLGKGKSFSMSQTVYNGTGTGLVCQFGRNGIERRFNLKRKPGEEEINGVIGEYGMTDEGVKLKNERIMAPNELKLLYERINAHLKVRCKPEPAARAVMLPGIVYA